MYPSIYPYRAAKIVIVNDRLFSGRGHQGNVVRRTAIVGHLMDSQRQPTEYSRGQMFMERQLAKEVVKRHPKETLHFLETRYTVVGPTVIVSTV